MKSLSYQLNSNHLTFLVIFMAILFSGNILLLKLAVNDEVKAKVKNKGEQVLNYVKSADTSDDKNLHEDQLSNQLRNYYLSGGEGCLIYDKTSQEIIELAGDDFDEEHTFSDDLVEKIERYTASSPKIFKSDLTNEGNNSFVYISTYNENNPNVLFFFYSSTISINNIGHYLAWIGAMFVFIFVVFFWMVFIVNRRLAAPYSEIALSLSDKSESDVNKSGKQTESMFIKRTLNLMESQLMFYEQNIEKSSLDKQKFEKEIIIARSIQNRILPKDIEKQIQNSGVEIEAKSEALFEVGGDFYDYYMLDEKHLLFTIGDVAGKGIPASLFMIFAQTTMRSIATAGMNAGEIVTKLNERILEENVSDLFFTLFLGILNVETGLLQYSNAAHNHPFFIKSSGSFDELSKVHGIPIGIYSNKTYHYSEIKLNNGDQIAVYTDGVVDTIDENEMDYSVDVLKYNLLGSWFLRPGEIIKNIFSSVADFRGNAKAVDDMTLLALKYSPPAKETL